LPLGRQNERNSIENPVTRDHSDNEVLRFLRVLVDADSVIDRTLRFGEAYQRSPLKCGRHLRTNIAELVMASTAELGIASASAAGADRQERDLSACRRCSRSAPDVLKVMGRSATSSERGESGGSVH
jgi:hypothetical protein